MVPADVDARIRLLAAQRGVSQSAVIVEAVQAVRGQNLELIVNWPGAIDGPEEALSEQVDATLYGA